MTKEGVKLLKQSHHVSMLVASRSLLDDVERLLRLQINGGPIVPGQIFPLLPILAHHVSGVQHCPNLVFV